MKQEKRFETESKQLLDLMINSIYSEQEIFLRELLSNASDAIDKYRFFSLQNPDAFPSESHQIRIDRDKKERTITITDNGIGMSLEDLEKNLGTIAKSGSKEFLEKFEEAKKKDDMAIIGQFGVGFYSAFMVADSVEVLSKPIDGDAHLFQSEGKDTYSVEDAEAPFAHGTSGKAISPLALSSRRSCTAILAFSSGCSSSVCMSLTRVMICSIWEWRALSCSRSSRSFSFSERLPMMEVIRAMG